MNTLAFVTFQKEGKKENKEKTYSSVYISFSYRFVFLDGCVLKNN
jgi:hypothetical protein